MQSKGPTKMQMKICHKYQTNIKPIYPRGGNERSKKWPLVLQVLPQWEFDTVKTTM